MNLVTWNMLPVEKITLEALLLAAREGRVLVADPETSERRLVVRVKLETT